MPRWHILLACLLLPAFGLAQQEKTLLSDVKMRSSGGWGGYRLQIGKIAGTNANISGFHLVGEYERKFLLGYNFNWLSSYLPLRPNGVERGLRLNWHSLQLGYIAAAHRVLHPVVNVDFGLGRVKMNDVGKDQIFVLNPSAGLELNVYRWFHLALEGGYRFVSNSDLTGLQKGDLSGFAGQMTLKFGWSE
jgi:hypothetical protein